MLLLSLKIAVASIVSVNHSNTKQTLKRTINGGRKKRNARSVRRSFAEKRQNVFANEKWNGNEKGRGENSNANKKDFVKSRKRLQGLKNEENSLLFSKRQGDKQNSMLHHCLRAKEHASCASQI